MIEADERRSMEQTVRTAIAHAIASDGSAAVDSVLAKVGWLELLGDEPDDAIDVVFTALGATNATASALDDVIASALGHPPDAGLAMLLPRFCAWEPPARVDGSELRAEGLATLRAATAKEILVVGGSPSEPWAVTVRMSAAEIHAVRGVDPDAGLHAVRVSGSAANVTRLDPGAWRSAVAFGQRAIAHQIAGASRAMLDLARRHSLERMQFGRPIARFQAVRHRLADALVAVEALDAALTAAREDPNADTARLAKAIAGRTAQTVTRHCQQLLAGIGFTLEHPFHRFARRALMLEGLFGSADGIAREIGRQLLADRRVPTLLEL